jgi:hypothetical protein
VGLDAMGAIAAADYPAPLRSYLANSPVIEKGARPHTVTGDLNGMSAMGRKRWLPARPSEKLPRAEPTMSDTKTGAQPLCPADKNRFTIVPHSPAA